MTGDDHDMKELPLYVCYSFRQNLWTKSFLPGEDDAVLPCGMITQHWAVPGYGVLVIYIAVEIYYYRQG